MTDEEIIVLQQEVFSVVEKYIQPDNIQSLLITSGILLKTAKLDYLFVMKKIKTI